MFKTGKFYAIQARNQYGDIIYCESIDNNNYHAERLKLIAHKAAKSGSGYYHADEFDSGSLKYVQTSENPFDLKTWPTTADVKPIIDHMRIIRKNAGSAGINPNSLVIVTVESKVDTFIPESPSDTETELRRFVLEKLSQEEKKLLKVEHWDVYNKLSDRSMLEEDDE